MEAGIIPEAGAAEERAPGAGRAVTPLELFFDLVYVFAIGQLSRHLLEHVDVGTAAETAIMTLAIIYAWYMVAWGANWLDPDRRPAPVAHRADVASLLMSAAIPRRSATGPGCSSRAT